MRCFRVSLSVLAVSGRPVLIWIPSQNRKDRAEKLNFVGIMAQSHLTRLGQPMEVNKSKGEFMILFLVRTKLELSPNFHLAPMISDGALMVIGLFSLTVLIYWVNTLSFANGVCCWFGPLAPCVDKSLRVDESPERTPRCSGLFTRSILADTPQEYHLAVRLFTRPNGKVCVFTIVVIWYFNGVGPLD